MQKKNLVFEIQLIIKQDNYSNNFKQILRFFVQVEQVATLNSPILSSNAQNQII